MSQMQRSFALWPETIWAEITSRLTPRDTFILTAVVGDKTLRHKLINGGVTTMSYKSSSAEKIVISLLPHFRALYRLSMEASPYSPDFNLRLLPPTLRELSIRAHCSTWLDAKCDDSTFLEDPRNAWYHTDGKCAFEFHTHLPNLDHLHLECTHAEPAHKTDPKLNVFGRILMLGVRCLPAKLKSLALSHLTLIYVQLWKYLNIQSLDRLELLDVANPDFLELVRQHAPWAPLLHATLSTSAKSLQGFTFPKNIRAITLRGWQEELSFGGPFTEYFGDLSLLKDLFPLSSSAQTDTNASKNSSTPFPTLDTLVVGYDSTTMNSQVFLPARKTLWIISYGPTDASISIETSFSTLTELRCDVPVAEETLVALTNLTTLSYQSGTASITKSFFDSLSPTLKTLELVAAGFVEEISGWLPRGLTSYSQRIVKPSEMPTGRGVAVIVIKRELNFLSPKFFKSLPPNLTSLSSPDNACEDFVYSSSAPKSLKYLNLSTIYFTGRSLEQGRRYFDQRNEFSAPPYRPGHDSPYKGPLEKSEAWVQRFLLSKDQPIVGNSPCHYSMGLRIQALPSSLTTLKLGDASSSHYTQTVILDMPHLTRMSLAHWHHWNWRSNTPSLTRLSVRDCDYTPHFQREYPEDDSSSANLFPPSLTRLHLSAISGYSNLKPVMPPYGLANQIKHLVLASSYLYSASSQREVYDSFKVLETIELATYQQGWEYLPKTLTSITYKSESPLPHSVTNLMRLFPKLRSLNITSASPITTDKELEQICESTRSSNAQNPSQNMPLDLLVLDYMVINDLSAYLRAPELHEKEILISDDPCRDWESRVKTVLMKRFKFLLLPKDSRIRFHDMGKHDGTHIRTELATFYPNLTHLELGSSVHVHKRFAKWIPRTLISLNVLRASGVDHTTAHYLPESLTTLHINATTFYSTSYAMLPRGLKHLFIDNSKFLRRHASKLPPNLETLHSDGQGWGLTTRLYLPQTLKSLKVVLLKDFEYLPFFALPPNLKSLTVSYAFNTVQRELTPPFTLDPPTYTRPGAMMQISEGTLTAAEAIAQGISHLTAYQSEK